MFYGKIEPVNGFYWVVEVKCIYRRSFRKTRHHFYSRQPWQREFAIRPAPSSTKMRGFYPTLSPKVRRGHKEYARPELNQIRSAKRSSLGSASRTQTRFRGDIPNHSSVRCTIHGVMGPLLRITDTSMVAARDAPREEGRNKKGRKRGAKRGRQRVKKDEVS